MFDRAGRGLHTPPPSPHSRCRSVEAHCSARARLLSSTSEECPVPPFQRLETQPFLRRRHRVLHPKTAGGKPTRTPCFRVDLSERPAWLVSTESVCVPVRPSGVSVRFKSMPCGFFYFCFFFYFYYCYFIWFNSILPHREIAPLSSNHFSSPSQHLELSLHRPAPVCCFCAFL